MKLISNYLAKKLYVDEDGFSLEDRAKKIEELLKDILEGQIKLEKGKIKIGGYSDYLKSKGRI